MPEEAVREAAVMWGAVVVAPAVVAAAVEALAEAMAVAVAVMEGAAKAARARHHQAAVAMGSAATAAHPR